MLCIVRLDRKRLQVEEMRAGMLQAKSIELELPLTR